MQALLFGHTDSGIAAVESKLPLALLTRQSGL